MEEEILLGEDICKKCSLKQICKKEKTSCLAIQELEKVCDATSVKERKALTRILRRWLNIRDAEPNKEMKALGESIIKRFPELQFIDLYNINIGYVISYENKQGQKIIYADCRKLNEVYKAYLPFDFIITFYYFNIHMLNENQRKILMLHELKHIQINERGLSVKPHDIEDFKDILEKYGNEWNEFNQEVPDILGGVTNG